MSRSYKKNAILKDGGNGYKKIAHHRTRMVVRNLLNSRLDYDELLFPNSRSIELIDPWDICDWKDRWDGSPIWLSWSNSYWTPKPSVIRKYKNK